MKSGLLEIADIHAITKSNLAGASKTLMDIDNAVHMRQKIVGHEDTQELWTVQVLPVSGQSGDGIVAPQQAMQAHFSFLQEAENMHKRCRRMYRQRIYREAIEILSQSFRGIPDECIAESLEQVIKRDITPSQAARDILAIHHDLTS